MKQQMQVCITDGGRKDAGYKGDTNDCVCRAIAIGNLMSYQDAYSLINETAASSQGFTRRDGSKSSARTGVFKKDVTTLLLGLGWTWTPTMGIGTGCTVHLKADELPAGRLIVNVSKHMTVVVDGVIYDTHDCSRDGTRCVYGYWQREQE